MAVRATVQRLEDALAAGVDLETAIDDAFTTRGATIFGVRSLKAIRDIIARARLGNDGLNGGYCAQECNGSSRSVRIDPASHAKALALRIPGVKAKAIPLSEALRRAVELLRRELFFEQMNAAFTSALRADPAAWAEEQRELGARDAGKLRRNRSRMRRSEVWGVDFDPAVGHEQGLRRPALILSADTWNAGPGGLVTVVPIIDVGASSGRGGSRLQASRYSRPKAGFSAAGAGSSVSRSAPSRSRVSVGVSASCVRPRCTRSRTS